MDIRCAGYSEDALDIVASIGNNGYIHSFHTYKCIHAHVQYIFFVFETIYESISLQPIPIATRRLRSAKIRL